MDLARDLGMLEWLPIQSYPQHKLYSVQKCIPRHRFTAAFLFIDLLVLILGGAISVTAYVTHLCAAVMEGTAFRLWPRLSWSIAWSRFSRADLILQVLPNLRTA